MEPLEYEDDEELIEPDPGHIAFLDQQSAAFESEREQFRGIYGFDHECTCGMDYSGNRVGVVTECFMRLSHEALNRCAYSVGLLNALGEALDQSITITNDLVEIMQELGHKKELDEYFQKEASIPEDQTEQFEQDLQAILNMVQEDNAPDDETFSPEDPDSPDNEADDNPKSDRELP